jgi:hypothetical protein
VFRDGSFQVAHDNVRVFQEGPQAPEWVIISLAIQLLLGGISKQDISDRDEVQGPPLGAAWPDLDHSQHRGQRGASQKHSE